MATTIPITTNYQPIGETSDAVGRSHKGKMAALGGFLVVGYLALRSGNPEVHTTLNTMTTFKINPFSEINCMEVSALPFCVRNPEIMICASCSDITKVKVAAGIQKRIASMKVGNPFSSINCTEINELTFCVRNPNIMICASCAEGEGGVESIIKEEDAISASTEPAVADIADIEALDELVVESSAEPVSVSVSEETLDKTKLRPIGAVCDFIDDHPLCDTFETTLPCEACECQQLQEEGKCIKFKYMMKCAQCLKKYGGQMI